MNFFAFIFLWAVLFDSIPSIAANPNDDRKPSASSRKSNAPYPPRSDFPSTSQNVPLAAARVPASSESDSEHDHAATPPATVTLPLLNVMDGIWDKSKANEERDELFDASSDSDTDTEEKSKYSLEYWVDRFLENYGDSLTPESPVYDLMQIMMHGSDEVGYALVAGKVIKKIKQMRVKAGKDTIDQRITEYEPNFVKFEGKSDYPGNSKRAYQGYSKRHRTRGYYKLDDEAERWEKRSLKRATNLRAAAQRAAGLAGAAAAAIRNRGRNNNQRQQQQRRNNGINTGGDGGRTGGDGSENNNQRQQHQRDNNRSNSGGDGGSTGGNGSDSTRSNNERVHLMAKSTIKKRKQDDDDDDVDENDEADGSKMQHKLKKRKTDASDEGTNTDGEASSSSS